MTPLWGEKSAQSNTAAALFQHNHVNPQTRLSSTLPASYPPKDTENRKVNENDAHEKCVQPEADGDGGTANTRAVTGPWSRPGHS